VRARNSAAIGRDRHQSGTIRRFFSALGPGLITGAADDDPSGVTTYSIAGAQMGTALLWTAFITWPLMAAVQFMCARIGMATGKGLADALGRRTPHWFLFAGAFALLAANTMNVGADLSGMADAAAMLTGINSHIYVVIFGAGIAVAVLRFRYQQLAAILKWLSGVLFAYIIAAFVSAPDWRAVLHDTFVPSWPKDHAAWQNLVAVLGTTISPYLFFWQTSQEVEEEKAMGRRMLVKRQPSARDRILNRKLDVGAGTFFSNLVMYFIILTTALALHGHGVKDIETSKQAAEALRPVAGVFAATLYTVGIIGVGMLAIPTLTASAAYAFAETFKWMQGLNESFRGATCFYAVLLFSTLVGIAMNFVGVNPITALFLAAIVNGLLAPFLLIGILLVASDGEIMRGQPSSRLSRIVVGITALAMFGAAIAMFIL
jgi:Mn2+/Fe2+ NRAMP family transporter